MQKNKDVGSFSQLICIILIVSNSLKILYYFGHSYDLCIFIQSILMMGIQIVLLRSFYIFKKENKKNEVKNLKISKLRKFKFLMSIFAILISFYSLIFFYLKNNFIIESTGTLSAIVESFLPIP